MGRDCALSTFAVDLSPSQNRACSHGRDRHRDARNNRRETRSPGHLS